jgi:integrase
VSSSRTDKPVFAKLEKPRVGQRDRVPTADEAAAILSQASPEFRLIHCALRQCGARPGELCRATIADIDRAANAIILREHKTARKTRTPRRIPIGNKLGELIRQSIAGRQACPLSRRPPAAVQSGAWTGCPSI